MVLVHLEVFLQELTLLRSWLKIKTIAANKFLGRITALLAIHLRRLVGPKWNARRHPLHPIEKQVRLLKHGGLLLVRNLIPRPASVVKIIRQIIQIFKVPVHLDEFVVLFAVRLACFS